MKMAVRCIGTTLSDSEPVAFFVLTSATVDEGLAVLTSHLKRVAILSTKGHSQRFWQSREQVMDIMVLSFKGKANCDFRAKKL